MGSKIIPIFVCGAILTVIASVANAQGTGITASPDQGISSNQCWDVSRNIIRSKDKDAVVLGGAPASTPETKVGTSASNPPSGPIEPTGSSPNASARPAGLPNC